MNLFELFNTKIDYENVHDDKYRMLRKAIIKNREILFDATSGHGTNSDRWSIEFYESTEDTEKNYHLTNSGGELQVFSFVLESVKELIKKHNPRELMFSAEKTGTESSRPSLYEKLIKKMKLPGYVLNRSDTDRKAYFSLVRTD